MNTKLKLDFRSLPPENIELIQAMGSKNRDVARKAQYTFAELLSPLVSEIVLQADTTGGAFEDLFYNENDDPSFPVDLYADTNEREFGVWYATRDAGLVSNQIYRPQDEVKFQSYVLRGAVKYEEKYARKARLDVVAKGITQLMQQVLVQTNDKAWGVLLRALAEAIHFNTRHVFQSVAAGTMQLDDLNGLIQRFARFESSTITGGTPVGGGVPTDLFISPERMKDIRGMAYNPVNNRGPNNTAIATPNTNGAGVALPDAERARIYGSAGVTEFYGLNITQLHELGKGRRYNQILGTYAGSTAFVKVDGSTGSAFESDKDDLVIAVNRGRNLGVRAIAEDSENGSVFNLMPDNQFFDRGGHIGMYGQMEEARVVIETRGLAGLFINDVEL